MIIDFVRVYNRMDGKAIEVKGLRKSFKDTEVLKGVDFEVKRGIFSPCLAPTARARRLSTEHTLFRNKKSPEGNE